MTNGEAIHRIQEHMRVHKMGQYPHVLIKEALDMSIDALREQEERRWIPLSEKLPSVSTDVLALLDNGECVIVVRYGKVWRERWTNLSLGSCPIYWMPLPELPKKMVVQNEM